MPLEHIFFERIVKYLFAILATMVLDPELLEYIHYWTNVERNIDKLAPEKAEQLRLQMKNDGNCF